MKIKTWHKKLKTKLEFNDSDGNAVKMIEDVPQLEEVLKILRKSIPVDPTGINLDKENCFDKIPKKQNEIVRLNKASKGLLWYLNLPPRWLNTATTIILFNIAVPPDDEFNPAITFLLEKNTFNIDKFSTLHISLRENIAFDKFKKELKRLKPEYDKLKESLPKNPVSEKVKNISYAKKIKILKEQTNESYGKIGDKIEKDFPKMYPTDYESVGQVIKKYNRHLKSFFPTHKMR